MLTRRQFLHAAAPAVLILPALADELLHPGRKFILPPTKIFTGAVMVPVRESFTLVEHRFVGRDGRDHRSQFWVRAADMDGLIQAVDRRMHEDRQHDYRAYPQLFLRRESIRKL